MSNHESIEQKILDLPEGSVFTTSDFVDITSDNNIRQITFRLENEGKIRRLLPGIYDKPYFSQILNEHVAPDPNNIAKAIARKNNWTIIPSGNVALNLLGLSTQVPANWEYLSSGQSKDYDFQGITIKFIHRADRELNGMSDKTALIIQALKALGREYISEDIRKKISEGLSGEEKERLLEEAKPSASWIYEAIRKICEDIA